MKILSADLAYDGVVIVFEDGKTALYPASLLYTALDDIERVIDGPGPEEMEEN